MGDRHTVEKIDKLSRFREFERREDYSRQFVGIVVRFAGERTTNLELEIALELYIAEREPG